MAIVIEVFRRVRGSHLRYTDVMGPYQKFDWIAQWPCPGCGRATVEMFGASAPIVLQVEGIAADPLCVHCRQRRAAGASLPNDGNTQ